MRLFQIRALWFLMRCTARAQRNLNAIRRRTLKRLREIGAAEMGKKRGRKPAPLPLLDAAEKE
jgi:hypothetical protein